MERYTREEHFTRLAATTETVRDFIRASPQFERYGTYLDRDSVWIHRIHDLESRFLRPLLVRNVLESVTGDADAWLRFPGVLAAAELFNISTYQGDAAIEAERDVGHSADVLEGFRKVGLPLSLSVITLSWSHALLAGAPLDQVTRDRLCRALAACAERVYRGQLQDGIDLRRTSGSDPFQMSERTFLRKYIVRCLNLDGFQFALYVFLGLNAALDKSLTPQSIRVKALLRVGLEFGTSLQILNDLDDFLTPDPETAFRDLETKRITFFAYVLWHHSSETKSAVETLLARQGSRSRPAPARAAVEVIRRHGPLLQGAARRLLEARYEKLRVAMNIARPFLVDDARALDFIFPHIFLSRILRTGPQLHGKEPLEASSNIVSSQALGGGR